MKCSICGKKSEFKIKGEKIYYCSEHAEEFFSKDCLECVKQIEKTLQDASKIKEFIENNKK